jgi:hypothetical protein
MSYNNLNVLSGGLMGISTAPDATESVMPYASRSLAGFSPFGYQIGKWEGWGDYEMKYVNRWKGDDIGVPTAAGLALTSPTSTNPTFIRVNAGSVVSTGRQVQSSDGTTSAAFARIYPKSGQFQHVGFRYKSSSSATPAFLLGLTEVNTGVLTTAGAINASHGIFIHKAAGSATVNLIVRVSGSTVVTIPLTTTNTGSQWYECWYRFDANSITVWFVDVAAGTQTIQTVDTTGSFATPPAALAITAAIVNGSSAGQSIDIQSLFAFAEAY